MNSKPSEHRGHVANAAKPADAMLDEYPKRAGVSGSRSTAAVTPRRARPRESPGPYIQIASARFADPFPWVEKRRRNRALALVRERVAGDGVGLHSPCISAIDSRTSWCVHNGAWLRYLDGRWGVAGILRWYSRDIGAAPLVVVFSLIACVFPCAPLLGLTCVPALESWSSVRQRRSLRC